MSLSVIATLVFIVSTATFMGLYLLYSRRSQSAAEKTLEARLSEATGGSVQPVQPSDASLLREKSEGPLPNVDRVARQALGGSTFELWLEQTGTGMSVSSSILMTLVFGVVGAFAAGRCRSASVWASVWYRRFCGTSVRLASISSKKPSRRPSISCREASAPAMPSAPA
jgi:hypothetical protein